MLWYKAWRESRVRFLLSAALIAGMCLMYALLASRIYPGIAHDTPRVRNYLQYIHWTVFGGATRGILQLSCLLLGLGGLQRDRSQGTLGYTLALPVSREMLVLQRAGVGLAQVFALSLFPPFLLTATSLLMHQHLPLAYGLPFIPLWTIGGFATYSLSFLCSVLIPSEYGALALAYVIYIFALAAARHPRLAGLHLHVADFMSGNAPHQLDPHTALWTGIYPITPLLGFFAAGLVMIAVATFITSRQDL
jgi:hypothetical protein